jgi:serine/threonine-protein kinase
VTAPERLVHALEDRYRIERELGSGGMATVYLAQDVRHNRKVALKVLRPELAAILGGERFLKEIQLTANLQHPHILALHDSGEADGIVYYVMPFVEGESLRDKLNREKQLSVDEAVRITREVASALDYAHRHGVIHRDVKPENILLHDGSALVADFGIAFAASRSDGSTRMTETGMSLGTPFYMAPEQAMGEREITPRADVYALGCVLYEMLAGEPPFTGPTAQAIIARVMTETPRSLTLQRHTIPPHVEAAARMALEKLPADRFTSASQFADALTHPGSIPLMTAASPAVALTGAGRRRQRVIMASSLILAAATGAGLWAVARPRPAGLPRQVVRFGVVLPRDAEPVGATGSTIAFSPDGSRIVYVGKAPSGQRLYVRGMDQVDPVPIPGSEGAILPFFSADSRTVGFKQDNKLVKVALAGGPVTPLCDAPGNTYGATWLPGDTIVFASDTGLFEVPAAGGTPRRIAKPDSGETLLWPEALPDGRAVLLSAYGHGSLKLAVLVRTSGQVKRLAQVGGYPRYINGGFVVLSDPSGLVTAVPFDAKRLEVTGAALPVTDKLFTSANGDRNMGISASGDMAFQSSVTSGNWLLLVDRSGVARPAGSDSGYYYNGRISPDGKRVTVSRFTDANLGSVDIWILDLKQRVRTRLTFDTTADYAVWSPDGRRIAYQRSPGGFGAFATSIYWVLADGSSPPESLVTTAGRWFPATFEPGGKALLYYGRTQEQTKSAIWRVATSGDRTPQQVLASGFNNFSPALSPDGKWMAYVSDESGRPEVYVRPYPGPGGRWQVSLNGGVEPVWSPNGREIFYRITDRMMAAAVRTQGGFEVGNRTELFSGGYNQFAGMRDYDVTPDGQNFTLFQQVQGAAQTVYVTLNWFDQLRREHR